MVTTVKKINVKKLAVAITLAIGSIIFLLISQIIVGAILLLGSMLLLMLGVTHEVITPGNKPIKRISYYFDAENIRALEKIIHEGVDEKSQPFQFNRYGNGRLDVIFTQDNEFLSLKLFRFVPHKYEEASGFIDFSGESARQMREYIKRSSSAK